MVELTLTEVKARLSEVVDRVEDGDTVLITRRGQVVAEIRSPERADPEAKRRHEAVAAMRALRATLPRGTRTPDEIKALCRDGLLGE